MFSSEHNLYISNLDEKVNEEILYELFLQCSPIVSIYLPKDKISNNHQGYCFIELPSEIDCEYCIKVLDNIKLYNKPIKISKSILNKNSQEIGANVYVGNLNKDVNETLLKNIFSEFGIVQSTKVMRDQNGESKGYGFIYYDNYFSSDKAIKEMNGQYINGNKVEVDYAYKMDNKKEKHGGMEERIIEEYKNKNNKKNNIIIKNEVKFGDENKIKPPNYPPPKKK